MRTTMVLLGLVLLLLAGCSKKEPETPPVAAPVSATTAGGQPGTPADGPGPPPGGLDPTDPASASIQKITSSGGKK